MYLYMYTVFIILKSIGNMTAKGAAMRLIKEDYCTEVSEQSYQVTQFVLYFMNLFLKNILKY